MEIREYTPSDIELLFQLMEQEGEEWADYFTEIGRLQYIDALNQASEVLVAVVDEEIVGFIRAIGSFTIYIDDLLVDKRHRGQGLGKKLIDGICEKFPEKGVYVMSDVDDYYHKLGYKNAGTLFEIRG